MYRRKCTVILCNSYKAGGCVQRAVCDSCVVMLVIPNLKRTTRIKCCVPSVHVCSLRVYAHYSNCNCSCVCVCNMCVLPF
jgi:hypothetical protein